MGRTTGKPNNTANIGFEAKLWLAADKLRNNMDAAEYKHVVLGLIFLKYISDTFEEHRAKLVADKGANPEDQDEYKAENVFWVPPAARWSYLQNSAKQPTIGKIVDDAMVAIERDNPRLKGVLPKDYARPGLDKHRLGELIDLIGTIALVSPSDVAQASSPASLDDVSSPGKRGETLAKTSPSPLQGERAGVRGPSQLPSTFGKGIEGEGRSTTHKSIDLLGRVYEYFLTRFASAEGKNGGQFYTPSCVVRLLVEMLAPYKGRVYDPACGSGGAGKVGSENYEGRKGPQRAHQAVRAANHSTVWKPAEINGGTSARQTTAPVRNIRWRKLSGSSSRTKQSRIHCKVRRLSAGTGRICLLAGVARRWRDRSCVETATPSSRVRRTHRHLRHHHQTSETGRMKCEIRMQKSLLHSSFLLPTFPVLANPPFNDSDWFRKDDDVRWQFGVPPKGNANFAWVQHFIHHLAPSGMAGFVLANGSMSSNQSGEGEIRRAIIEADLVNCMVALPGQLFYSTQIPVCLWFLTRNKSGTGVSPVSPKKHGQDARATLRDRRKQTLFIDARKMGTLIDRVHRELTDADIEKIVNTYHAWRGDGRAGSPLPAAGGHTSERRARSDAPYLDVPGFCKSATTAEIAAHGYVLTPGRYVGAEEVEDDGEPFEEKMPRLVAELNAQFCEPAKLEKGIKANLRGLGYGV